MHDHFQKLLETLQKDQLEKIVEKDIEIKTRILSQAYDKAIAYTNMLIAAGYAAAFTVWSLTKNYLPEKAMIAVALGLTISLFTFCVWELFKMIYTSGELRKLGEVLLNKTEPEKYFQEMSKIQSKANKDKIRLLRYWIAVLVVAISTGLGASMLLLYNFAANLLNYPLWPA